MTLDLGAINWLAVIIATVVYFALGAVWFAPWNPVGRTWVSSSGYESATSGRMSGNIFYIMPVAGAFVVVLATALLARATGTDTLGEGIVLGLVLALGFAVPILVVTAAFEFSKPRQFTWGLIDASYHAIGMVAAAVIMALLR